MRSLERPASYAVLTPDSHVIDDATLRDLASLGGPERAFLTVYLDHGDDWSAVEPTLARIRALLADQPAEAEHFEESLKIVRQLHAQSRAPDGGAVAMYASWAADLGKAYTLPAMVGTTVWMGDAPYLRPAYELLDEQEPYAVAVIDNTSAQVFLVRADDVHQTRSLRGDVKNSVKKGGWSQKRYARRRDKQIETYATEVAAGLAELADQATFDRLVLVGSDEPVRAVKDALRTDLADRLVGTDSLDGNASEGQALEAAADMAERGEREAEQELWHQIREQGMGPGLVAFGATSVTEAVRGHRAEAVLVDRDASFDGSKCRDCETVVHGTPDTCGVCGSSDVFRVDLVESITQQALRSGAQVDYADPFPALTEVGGIAALLRYSLSQDDAEQQERERRDRAQRQQEQRDEAPSDADSSVPADPEAVLADEPTSAEPSPTATGPIPDPAPVERDPEPVAAEPAAAEPLDEEPVPVAPDTLKPAEQVAKPRPPEVQPAAPARNRRPRASAPRERDPAPSARAAKDAPAAKRGRVGRWVGVALLLLGGLQIALGIRDLPAEGLPELLLGGGLVAAGAIGFVSPSRKAMRTVLGAIGLLLAVAGLVLGFRG